VHLVGFITKKNFTMHGHTNVKCSGVSYGIVISNERIISCWISNPSHPNYNSVVPTSSYSSMCAHVMTGWSIRYSTQCLGYVCLYNG